MTILLSNIDRQHFTDRAPWTPYWSDCYKYQYDPYFEFDHGRPNLVICYGDSWTWGDSLGASRQQDVYGNHVANALNANFVNSAVPGIMNYWIHDRLSILCQHDLPRLQSCYDKIYIVVTLTELGRDFEFDHYIKNFQNFYDWTSDAECSGEKILIQAENFDFNKLQQIQNQLPTNCHMIVGRNFTHSFDQNLSSLDNLMPKSWTDILLQQQNMLALTDVRIMSHGIQKFNLFMQDQKLDNQQFKNWFLDTLSVSANKQIDLLNKSVYNYKKASKHPNAAGHQLWADYIVNYIKTL